MPACRNTAARGRSVTGKHLPPCRDCEKSARELWHGVTADCRGCQARSVGRSPQFFRARRRRQIDSDYLAVLAAVFRVNPKNEESWRPAHDEVKAAFDLDAMYEKWKAGEPA
jgi:hypothetical protein